MAQVNKDKTDLKNKELLKRMQEKARKMNAYMNEKNQREEQKKIQKMERD